MLVYYIQLILVLLIGIYENIKVKFLVNSIGKRRQILILSFWVLFLFAALRKDTVGGDLINYKNNYFLRWNNISLTEFINSIFNSDIGYSLLNWFVGVFTDNFNIFMALVSGISIFLFIRFYSRYSYAMWLSVYLFITWGMLARSYNILRQVIAMSIIYIGIKFIQDRKLVKFIIIVFVATMFHKTAWICLPMYIMGNEKLNRRAMLMYTLAFYSVIVISLTSLGNIAKLYTNNDYSENMIVGGGTKLWILLILILATSLIYYKQTLMNNSSNLIFYNIMIMACIIQIFSFGFSLLTRLTDYYSFSLTVLLPNVIYSIKNRNIRIVAITGVVIMGFLFFMFNMRRDFSGIVPYNFFWE